MLKTIQKDLDAMCIGIYSQFKIQHQQLPAIEILDGKIPQTTVIKMVQASGLLHIVTLCRHFVSTFDT